MTVHKLIRQAKSLAEFDDLYFKSSSSEYPLIYANQIDVEDDINYVIDDWLPTESIALLYSPKDHYKSFVAVDWFMSIASGIGWKGFEVLRGACVYIAGEGNRGLNRRFQAWCIRHDVDLKRQPIALSTMPMQTLDKENIQVWA